MNNFWCLENAWLFIVLIVGYAGSRQQHANVKVAHLPLSHTPPTENHPTNTTRRPLDRGTTFAGRRTQLVTPCDSGELHTSRMHFPTRIFIYYVYLLPFVTQPFSSQGRHDGVNNNRVKKNGNG